VEVVLRYCLFSNLFPFGAISRFIDCYLLSLNVGRQTFKLKTLECGGGLVIQNIPYLPMHKSHAFYIVSNMHVNIYACKNYYVACNILC
jgi:hypothetical protein